MDILLQSDGLLYPPQRRERKPNPPPKPLPKPEPPPSNKKHSARELPWEEFLLMAVAYILIKNSDQPDIPLLLALGYVLLDQKFSIQNFLK